MIQFLMQHQLTSLVATSLLLLGLLGCTAHYLVHPGALNTADSAAYDTLLMAKAAIDQARTDDQAGRLPASARDAINTLVQAYNVARESWLMYRGAVSTNTPTDQYYQQLNQNLTNLVDAIGAFKQKAPGNPTLKER